MQVLVFLSTLCGIGFNTNDTIVVATLDGDYVRIDDARKARYHGDRVSIDSNVWSQSFVDGLEYEIEKHEDTIRNRDSTIEELQDQIMNLTDEITSLRNMLNEQAND